MSLSNIKHRASQKGFTIVELLIVVVIIGILAAIVVVAYNGLTNRAKSANSQSTASSIAKKFEAYNAEMGSYPTTYAALTGAATTASYYIPASTYTLKTTAVVTGDSEKHFNYANCTGPVGKRISVWNWDTGALAHTYLGGATSSSSCTLATS